MQALAFAVDPERFIATCRRRFGDVVTFRLPGRPPVVMIFDPALIKEVLRGELPTATDAPVRELIGARSLFGLEGAEHLERRRQLAPRLHGQLLRMHTRLIRELTDRAIDSWPLGAEFALLPSLRRLTAEATAALLFGLDGGDSRTELLRRMDALMRSGPSRRGQRRSNGTVERRRAVDALLYEEISRRRAAPDRYQDVMSGLMLVRDQDGQAIADQELCDELAILQMGGTDTTAAALAWALELLLRHPPILERLEAELAGGSDEYLRAVVKETLRLHPPIPELKRVVGAEPYALGPYVVPPGAEIRMSLAAMHRRADEHADPLAFRPERFLQGGGSLRSAWLPFGTGPHRCPGANVATFEMPIVIRRVLERRHVRPVGSVPEDGPRRGFVRAPTQGVRVIAKAR